MASDQRADDVTEIRLFECWRLCVDGLRSRALDQHMGTSFSEMSVQILVKVTGVFVETVRHGGVSRNHHWLQDVML
jgi:hypothetical protein